MDIFVCLPETHPYGRSLIVLTGDDEPTLPETCQPAHVVVIARSAPSLHKLSALRRDEAIYLTELRQVLIAAERQRGRDCDLTPKVGQLPPAPLCMMVNPA